MRRHRKEPDYTSSLLDLLLGSLGVVALFVFLFAAIRRQSSAAGVKLTETVVEIQLSDRNWQLTRHVGVEVESPEGDVYQVLPAVTSGSRDFRVVGGAFPAHRYPIRIGSEYDEPSILRVWLRRLPETTLMSGRVRQRISALTVEAKVLSESSKPLLPSSERFAEDLYRIEFKVPAGESDS